MAITEKVVVEGDTTSFVAALKKAGTALDKTSDKAVKAFDKIGAELKETLTNDITKSFLSANAALAVFNKALGVGSRVMSAAIDNAAAYFRSTEKLSAALRQANMDVESSILILNNQSSALQAVTGTSDDVIRSMQAQALAVGVSASRVDDFVRAAFRLANAAGVDANTAMRQLTKTLAGTVGEAGELTPALKELTAEQLRAGEAATVINTQFREFLDIATRGLPGELLTLSNAFEDLTEAIVVRASPEGGVSVFGLITDELNDLTTLISKGGATDALLKFAAVFTKALFVLPGFHFANAQINELLKERLALLNAGATNFPPAGAGGGPAGAGGGGGGGAARGVTLDALTVAQVTGPTLEDAPLARRNPEIVAGLEQTIADRRAEIRQANAERMADITLSETERIRSIYEEQGQRLLDEQMARNEVFRQGVQQAVGITASFITGALEAITSGADFSEFVKSFLKATGTQMIGQGIQNALQGLALSLLIPGNPQGVALATLGGAQIATGTAMLGGSLVIPAAARKASGGGGGGGGGPSRLPSPGGGGGGGGGGRNITVIFNGPTTKPEVGLAIREALAEADAVGV